jgi:hypothetical protein
MLHTITMEQALGVWSDLEQSYFGKSSYGSDTVEIYMYRFMSGAPREVRWLENPGIFGDMARESYDNANAAMLELFTLFSKMRKARIEVEGRELGEWLKTARFTHRVHVKVTPQ